MTGHPSPANRPTKQRRRRPTQAEPASRAPSPDEDLYEIRDIIDEKRVKGKLLYKVDWADHPTTGETYAPTWEPAENVTEAAIVDWEREKERRRRRAVQPEGSPAGSETHSSQPVLPPNWRAQRRRALSASVSDDEERAPKRSRGSVDSGYTSTGGDSSPSWAFVQSVPHKKGELVCEISVPPAFDPSEYRIISSSQSAPSSQYSSFDIVGSQGKGNAPSSGLVSQRTIPDSQDGFESLRTQFTTQSAPELPAVGPAQPGFGSAREERAQATDGEQYSNAEGQASRSELNIPSHQPGASHFDSRRSTSLRDSQEPGRASGCGPLDSLTSALQEQEGSNSSEGSSIARGFLTQPDFEPPLPQSHTESSEIREAPSSSRSLERHRRQEQEPDEQDEQSTLAPEVRYTLSASESRPESQAAQRVSRPDNLPEQFLTQLSEAHGQSEDIVPETVQRGPRRRSTSRSASTDIPSPNPEAAAGVYPPDYPQDQSMDRPPQEAPPPSAVDVFRRLHAEVFGTSPETAASGDTGEDPTLFPQSTDMPGTEDLAHHPGGNIAEPAHQSVMLETSPPEHPRSAPEELNRHIEVSHNSVPSQNAAASGRSLEYEQPSATVAPADLTASVHDHFAPGDAQFLDELAPHSVSAPDHERADQFPLDAGADEPEDESNGRHFTVTLPMAANTRATYVETVLENRATMIEFGEVFANSYSRVPETSLVAKLDAIFERLLNLCDLPSYNDSIPDMDKEAMMKHATNSNSKFLFVYEFLHGLRDIHIRVLVLSQPGRVFEFLEALVATANYPYTVLGLESSPEHPPDTEGLSVVLAVVGQDLTKVHGGFDVVIAFDHAAKSVELPATLGYESMEPIVLSLVATHSLEHIDIELAQVEQGLEGLERKNALNLAIAEANKFLRNPNPDPNYLKPHRAAKIFADFLRNPEHGLDWEPDPLPSQIFEFWLSSQERTQLSQGQVAPEGDVTNGPGARKRVFEETIEEGTPKRPRLLLESQQPSRTSTPVLMSDLLKQTLADNAVDSGAAAQLMEVPVEQLERMSAKIAELEARLSAQSASETKLREHVARLESQLRSHKRTIQSIEPKYMEALRDRRDFEKQCKAAVAKATAATERFEVQKAELEALKEKNKALESKLSEANSVMASSTVPDIAKLARAEKERGEALAAVEKLEKKVRTLQNEVEYSRKAYQDASNAHSELDRENQELRDKVADLERRAGENLLRIHKLHARNEADEAGRQIEELQAILENRERELDRAKDELRALKNGRRETRQASVPRSPRMGVISPRPGRAVGGAGSRGTSPAPFMSSDGPGAGGAGSTPVPGMAFFPPVGNNGRWGHLRD